jgi:hypothetical protein
MVGCNAWAATAKRVLPELIQQGSAGRYYHGKLQTSSHPHLHHCIKAKRLVHEHHIVVNALRHAHNAAGDAPPLAALSQLSPQLVASLATNYKQHVDAPAAAAEALMSAVKMPLT